MIGAMSMTAYQRPDYLISVLESLHQVEGVARLPLHVSVEPSAKQGEIQAALAWFEMAGHDVDVTVNEARLGCSMNTRAAVERAFAYGHDAVLHLEEDILVGPDLLVYAEWALEQWRDDPGVMAVCCWSDAVPLRREDTAVELRDWFSPQVWAIWRDRWEDIREDWDPDYKWGGWDWNINRRLRGPRRCAFPVLSRVQHIGLDGGTHTTPESFQKDAAPEWTGDPKGAPMSAFWVKES